MTGWSLYLHQALYDRVEEHQKRPDAVQALLDMLNATGHFVSQSEESVTQGIISETDLNTLKKMVSSTKVSEQDVCPKDYPAGGGGRGQVALLIRRPASSSLLQPSTATDRPPPALHSN